MKDTQQLPSTAGTICKHTKSQGVESILGSGHNPAGWHPRPVQRTDKAEATDFVEALTRLIREFELYPVGLRATQRKEPRSEPILGKVTRSSEKNRSDLGQTGVLGLQWFTQTS